MWLLLLQMLTNFYLAIIDLGHRISVIILMLRTILGRVESTRVSPSACSRDVISGGASQCKQHEMNVRDGGADADDCHCLEDGGRQVAECRGPAKHEEPHYVGHLEIAERERLKDGPAPPCSAPHNELQFDAISG